MFVEYIPLIFMVLFGFVMAVVFLLGSEYLGARRSTKEKQTTYESGMIPFGTARERLSVKFYLVAMSFIVFDIEVVFLYPWAVNIVNFSGAAAHIGVIIFGFILFAGYYWEFRKGGFKWD